MNRREAIQSGTAAIISATIPSTVFSGLAFAEYVDAINSLAIKYGAVGDSGIYADAEAWREFFEDGFSPEEAWRIEMSYWEAE